MVAHVDDFKLLPPKPPEPTKPSDLMEALRQSAHNDSEARAEKRKTAAPRKVARSKTTKRRKAA